MAKPMKALVKTPSRQWLTIAGAGFCLVVGILLVYRQIGGTTMKEQKIASQKEREAKELGAKNPGNAEAFSTRLENSRKDFEAQIAKDAEKARMNGSGSGPLVLGGTPSVSASTSTGTATSTFDIGKKLGRNGAFPSGSPQGEPSDAQVDAYAAQKEENARIQSIKLSSWEASGSGNRGGGGAGGANGDAADSLAAQISQAQATAPAPASPGNALMEAYLRSQGKPAEAASSKDSQFIKGLEDKSSASAQALRVQAGVGRYAVLEGTAIPIVMRTSISSDLPGPCRASVESDVYDSVTASTKLIPAGTTVICVYNSEVVQGQDRLLIAFTRLVFPNGSSVALGGMQASDEQGAIGAQAEVNTRFWRTFGSAFLIAAVTRLAERSQPTSGVTINTGSGGSSGGVAAGVLSDMAKRSLERNLNIKPELKFGPGERLRMIVSRDMVLDPTLTQVR
jgi:type IV secretion system protein TrbI